MFDQRPKDKNIFDDGSSRKKKFTSFDYFVIFCVLALFLSQICSFWYIFTLRREIDEKISRVFTALLKNKRLKRSADVFLPDFEDDNTMCDEIKNCFNGGFPSHQSSTREGPVGPPGIPGSPGLIGPTGKPGRNGEKGDRGLPGIDGYKGEFGTPGMPGLRGPIGKPGQEGQKGDRGLTGPRGEEGKKGDSGPKGNKGDLGPMGPRGMTVPRGARGKEGLMGYPGFNGDKGELGFPGIPGLQGPIGKPGQAGPKGYVADPGPSGVEGKKGDTGPKGKDQVPISVNLTTPEKRFPVGKDLELVCEFQGYLPPRIAWFKDGVSLTSSRRINIEVHPTGYSRLILFKATKADSAVYECEAKNEYSRATSSAEISVEEVYIPPRCTDNHFFANCTVIVASNYCKQKYYSKFCCRSCTEAGLLPVNGDNSRGLDK